MQSHLGEWHLEKSSTLSVPILAILVRIEEETVHAELILQYKDDSGIPQQLVLDQIDLQGEARNERVNGWGQRRLEEITALLGLRYDVQGRAQAGISVQYAIDALRAAIDQQIARATENPAAAMNYANAVAGFRLIEKEWQRFEKEVLCNAPDYPKDPAWEDDDEQ